MNLHEEGVSESIGYIIIFGLVMTGIGLITLYGYPVLMQKESEANIKNMEQTMIVLQNDVKSLTYKLVPYKETSLRVSGGALTLFPKEYNDQSFSICKVAPCGDPLSEELVGSFGPGELRFQADKENAVISLENGAVMERRIGTTGSFMLAQPRWYDDEDPITGSKTLMINYISLDNTTRPEIAARSQLLSQTGVGTVRMRHFQTLYWSDSNLGGADIWITYTPNTNAAYDYSQAWRNFLTDTNGLGMEEIPAESGQYRMAGVSSIVVKEYDLIVEEL